MVFDILIRFRTYAIALTSDIEKAFQQVSVREKDREFLKFLWFDNAFSDQPKIVCNRFARVIFDSPYAPYFCETELLENTPKTMNLTLILRIKFLTVFTLMISQVMKAISTKLLTCLRN